MSSGLLYWILMLLWLLFGLYWNYGGNVGSFGPMGNTLLLFILLLILGWHSFGAPLK